MTPAEQIAELQHEARVCKWVMEHNPTLSPWRRAELNRQIAIAEMTVERLRSEERRTT